MPTGSLGLYLGDSIQPVHLVKAKVPQFAHLVKLGFVKSKRVFLRIEAIAELMARSGIQHSRHSLSTLLYST
jgi:hypothetical protein